MFRLQKCKLPIIPMHKDIECKIIYYILLLEFNIWELKRSENICTKLFSTQIFSSYLNFSAMKISFITQGYSYTKVFFTLF